MWDRKKNGEVYPRGSPSARLRTSAGEIVRFVAFFSDITPMKKTEEQLYYLAHYDPLTGLANRRQFQDLLVRSLKSARRKSEMLAVMFIDLDSFKEVNDNLGHRAGDQVLQEIARRIQRSVRETDTVARMGGDEFTVILSHLADSETVSPLRERSFRGYRSPWRWTSTKSASLRASASQS